MNPLKTRALTRQQIGEFVNSERGIRAFEDAQADIAAQYEAITDASFLTLTTEPGLGSERVFTPSGDFAVTDGGPNSTYVFALSATGVVAGAYGDASHTVSLTVDSRGRLSSVTSYALNTDNITEGATNLYFTTARARAAISGSGLVGYNNTTGVISLPTDTDGTLASNSDGKIATQKAVKTYVDNAVTGLLDFKGSTDCSANPNFPAAFKGDAYVVSVAGRIGGASGKVVDVGDVYVASADNAGGTEAAVGTSWFVLEHNLQGALLAANNLSDLTNAATARTNLGVAIGSNVQAWDADLDALAALGGTNTIYYRSGSNTWAAVTIGGNLSFSGGTLAVDKTLDNGTYSPTAVGVTNVAGVDTPVCHYIRIGDVVHVSGKVNIQPTAATTSTVVAIPLPIASNFSATTDLSGNVASAGVNQSGSVEADTVNDRASLRYISQDTSTRGMFFNFSYKII